MRILVFLCCWLWLSVAQADCIYNGESYPTGTVVGPLVCQPDGTWKRR